MESRPGQDSSLIIIRVVWLSQILTVVLFAVLGIYFVTNGLLAPSMDQESSALFMYGVLVFSAAAVFAANKINTAFSTPEYVRSKRGPDEQPEDFAKRLPQIYFQRCIIRWALLESAGVTGLVCLLTTGSVNLAPCGALFAAVLFLMILWGPNQMELDQMKRHASRF